MKAMRGFSLPTAIFLLVILALLGAFMVSLSTTQSAMSAQDVQGSRAYLAARGGVEWFAGQVCYGTGIANPAFPASTSCPTQPLTACPAASTTLNVNGVNVTVLCWLSTHDEGGTPKYIFYVTSTANIGGAVGTVGRVERMVSSFVEF
jgi:MSHA biogenesis protein MshP